VKYHFILSSIENVFKTEATTGKITKARHKVSHLMLNGAIIRIENTPGR